MTRRNETKKAFGKKKLNASFPVLAMGSLISRRCCISIVCRGYRSLIALRLYVIQYDFYQDISLLERVLLDSESYQLRPPTVILHC